MSIRSFSIALVATLSAVPAALPAQRWTRPIRRFIDHYYGIEIGITGGPNWTTTADAGSSVDGRFRGSLGGFASFPVSDPLRIRAELLVTGTQMGLPQQAVPPCLPTVLCDPVEVRVIPSFTWLQLPLLLEARFHRALGGDVSPRLFAGPFVAVRLACSMIQPILTSPPQPADPGKTVTPCASQASTSSFNNGDAGFVAGAGLAIGGFGLNARWTRSLVPIAPNGSAAGPLAGAKQSTLAVFVDIGTRLHR